MEYYYPSEKPGKPFKTVLVPKNSSSGKKPNQTSPKPPSKMGEKPDSLLHPTVSDIIHDVV